MAQYQFMLENISTNDFSFIEAYELLFPLLPFILGVVVYSLFIFQFYKILSRRNLFELDTSHYGLFKKILGSLFYIIGYVVAYPIFAFLWFAVLSALLLFLTPEQTIGTILITSMSLVASIRIVAYINENLSQDLAKMVPFALLGNFILKSKDFSVVESLNNLTSAVGMWKTMAYFLISLSMLELILRIIYRIIPKKEAKKTVSED